MFGFGGGSGGGGTGNGKKDGNDQGGANRGGFFTGNSKKPASPTAAGTPQASSFFGQSSVFGSKSGLAGQGSGATRGGFGGASFTSLAQTGSTSGTPAFGSGSGFGGIKKETGGAAGFGAGSGFGAAPKTSGKNSTGTSGWSTAAAGALPAASPTAASGFGFGTGGGFGTESVKKSGTASAPSWATVAKTTTTAATPSAGGFGAGSFGRASFTAGAKTGFGGAGSFAGASASDAVKMGFGGATGGSFADAAKRGNASGGGDNSGTGGIKPSAGFGKKGGFGSGAGSGPTFAPAGGLSSKPSGVGGRIRQRESESGGGGDKGAGGSRGRSSTIMGSFGGPPPGITASDPPVFAGGGRLGNSSGASKSKNSRGSVGGSKIFGAPPPGIASADPPAFTGAFGSARGASKLKAGRALTSGASKILGGPPTGTSSPSSPPAFVGGTGSGSGGGGGSRIMGGFGGPPPGVTSSDPPAFVGGGRTGGTGGVGSKSKSRRTASLGGSKILGGPPPGIAPSDPPTFAGGGGNSGATADDAAAKARRAKRFAGAGGGGGGGGGSIIGKSRSSAGAGGGGAGSGGGAAEDVQRGSHLDDAEVKKGTVEAMCPAEEMSRRVPGDLHILEKEHPDLFMPDTGDGGPPRLWSHDDLVVKRHQRAAAGMDISKPELLRTPLWLAHTVDHLVMNCVDKGPHGGGDPAAAWDDPRIQEYVAKFRANNPSRADSAEEETEHDLYNFIWDRFRMIRSDYNMQGYNPVVGLVSEASIVAHERMARWYVLMANRMEKNTMQTHRFNLKSIVETLKKLYEFYTIRVTRGEVIGGLASPNEPEIMAYYLLTVLEQDGGVEVQRLVKDLVRSRRREILDSPEIKGALKIVRAWHAGDYVAFFRALRQQGVMHRCLLSQYVKTMRNTAINMIAASFSDFSLSELIRLLCFEDEDQAVDFLDAYSLRVSDTGQVHLRMKDQVTGKWKITFRRPDAIPDPPPLQDLVEPKPWRLASEWVCKGDYEPSANKSHDVTAVPQQQLADGAEGAAALKRATSSSSSSGPALMRRPSKSHGTLPATSAQAGFSSFAPTPGDGVAAAAPGAAAGSAKPTPGSVPSFGGSAQIGIAGSAAKALPGQTPTPAASGALSSTFGSGAPTASTSGFVFAPHGPAVATGTSGARKIPAGGGSTAPSLQPGFPPLGSTADGGTAAPATSSGADVPCPQSTGGQSGDSGASSVSSRAALAPAPASTLVQAGGDSVPTAAAAAAANGDRTNAPAAPSAGGGNTAPSATDAFKFTRPAPRDPARKRAQAMPASAPPAGDTFAQDASAAAASAASKAQRAAREEANRAMHARQRREKAEAEEKRRKEQAAARERAAAAAVAAAEEAKLVRSAEVRAERALGAGKLVPWDVIDKLPADGSLRRLALDHRKSLGLRLAQLGVAVLRRRRSAAWSLWVEETRCWVEEQHLIDLRNNRFEEHSALTDHTPFLRRNKKSRSLSFNETDGGAGHVATTGARAATVARRQGTAEAEFLRKPQPLDLAAAVTPGVLKNQGADAEEVFRSVGLTTVAGPRTKAREQSAIPEGSEPPPEDGSPFSPPHVFWKAVVVAPSRTRGNVGAWLEAKFAAGGGGAAERASRYRGDLAAHGLCPEQEGGAAPLVEDCKEVACGSSASSKLIYRALRKVSTNTSARPGNSVPPSQFVHLCVQRISVKKGHRLQPSPQLSEKFKSASVVVLAVTPRDHDRFFWSPLHPKPDWSQAREDLKVALESTSPREFLGVPVLVVIPVKESALQRGACHAETAAFHRIRERILEDAWEGLGLREVAKQGSSFRVALVGLHEFESRSKAAAATAENLVFAGGLEEACSEDVASKLAELAEKAPRQPLVATRCLQEVLDTAVSRATTNDGYADAAGLPLSGSRYEDPPLGAVVGAASRATEHLCRLLARKSNSWPIPEFATTVTSAEGGQQREVIYVPGAARAAEGEIARSPLVPGGGSAHLEGNDAANAWLRRAMGTCGGLPLKWATALPSFGSPSQPDTGVAGEADSVLRASFLPPVPQELAEAFSPNVLAGREGARHLGPQAAWGRVRELDAYLGKGLMPEELRFRLAEALAGGMMMRGPPPPWRTLVRDATARRVALARGRDRERPLVVHFIAAFGQDRLNSAMGDVVVPGLLEAENFRAVETIGTEEGVLTPSRDPAGNRESVEARALATLKRVAPVIADSRPMKYVAKHRRTSSYSSPGASGEASFRRGYFYGTGDGKGAVYDDDDDRLLSERVGSIALETEKLRTSRERAASVAAADLALDADFLKSFGVSLTESGVASGGAPSSAFDRERVASVPRGFGRKGKTGSKAEERKKKARQRKAAETLSAAEYKCWEVREEIEGYRRQEEEIRAQIFDGDPLLLLLDSSGGGVDEPRSGVSTP